MDTQRLGKAFGRWLQSAAGGQDWRYPADLDALFNAEQGPRRFRAARRASMAMAVVATALTPILLRLFPDAAMHVLIFWGAMVLPVAYLNALLCWYGIAPDGREIRGAAVNVLALGCAAIVLTASRHAGATLLLAATLLVVQLGLAHARLSLRVGALAGAAILAIFALTIWRVPGITRLDGAVFLVIVTIIVASVLTANSQFEREVRWNFAVAAREKLKRHDLTRQNFELHALARSDSLTGLANRRAYDTWLATVWREAEEKGQTLGMLVIDVDRFKAYNDFYGHQQGDHCLQSIAACLRDQMRNTSDFLARVGGEEFAVLLPGLSLEICGDVAERLRAAVAAMEVPNLGAGPRGMVTVSVGATSLTPRSGLAADALFAAADSALYCAKSGGRDRVALASMPAPARTSTPAKPPRPPPAKQKTKSLFASFSSEKEESFLSQLSPKNRSPEQHPWQPAYPAKQP